MEHDRAAEDPGHGGREGTRAEQLRVDGGLGGAQLDGNEHHEEHDHCEEGGQSRRGRARAQRDEEGDDRGTEDHQATHVQRPRSRTDVPQAAGGEQRRDRRRRDVAIGTASENIDRQPNRPTSTPPMNGPIAALTDVSRSNSPNASPRRPGGAISGRSQSSWWRRRPRHGLEHAGALEDREGRASDASSDANPNPSTPARNVDRWPNRSPSEPATGNATATAARYSVTTDATSFAPRPNSPMIPGSATASIVVFSGTRIAPHATPSIRAESIAPRSASLGTSDVTAGG